MTGFELNRAAKSTQFDNLSKYCLIWFDKDEVAILQIKNILLIGTSFEPKDFRNAFSMISSLDCTQINSEPTRKWKVFGREYLTFIDPRER